MLLDITDGTTTIYLNDDSATPTTPLAGAVYFPRDPGSSDTATESASVGFSGAVSTLRSVTNWIEKVLQQATDPDAPDIYIEYRPTDSGAIYRSPLHGGRIVWSENKAARQMGQTNSGGEFAVVFERANYWEGAEATLGTGSIKNGTTSPYNALTLSTAGGTLPAPLWVEIANANGGAIGTREFFLNIDNYVGLTTNQQFVTSSTTVGDVKIFGLSSAVLGKFAGQDAQVIVGLTSVSPPSFYAYAAAYTTIGGVYQEVARGKEIYVNNRKLLELGTIPLPPGGEAITDFGVAFGVYPSVTSGISFLHIAPAKHALHLHQIGYNLTTNGKIVEDGYDKRAYMQDSSNKYEIIRRSGGPLMVCPGQAARVHCLYDQGATFTPSGSMMLTVKYRPRRATI